MDRVVNIIGVAIVVGSLIFCWSGAKTIAPDSASWSDIGENRAIISYASYLSWRSMGA